MKIFLALVTIVAIGLPFFPAVAQVTGTMNLTDSLYAPIGTQYPPGTVRAYAEVVDPDKNADTSAVDTLSVVFSSPSDSGETVVLSETGTNTGIFHGSINLDVLPGLVYKGKTVRAWMEEILKTETDSTKRNRRKMELMKDIGDELKRGKEMKTLSGMRMTLASDGLLQIHAGETMTLTYYDQNDNAGAAETITSSAVLGGVSGTVSGVWTKANSPYTVTSDVYVNSDDSLKIEAGVVVKFWGGTTMYVYGSLETQGASGDSVYFTSVSASPSPGDWAGICVYNGTMVARFSVFSYGGYWTTNTYSYGTITNYGTMTLDN